MLLQLLHRNTLCNRLLSVVERGFKNPDQDVRHASFKAWQALIDNFALAKGMIIIELYLCVFFLHCTALVYWQLWLSGQHILFMIERPYARVS